MCIRDGNVCAAHGHVHMLGATHEYSALFVQPMGMCECTVEPTSTMTAIYNHII